VGGEPTDPALVSAAVGVVAATGTDEDHAAFVERFRTAATPQDMQRFLYALADFPGADSFARTLELSISDDVRSQNAGFLVQRALRNRDRGCATRGASCVTTGPTWNGSCPATR
jgi:puromycin-sensitive aminopeptidase